MNNELTKIFNYGDKEIRTEIINGDAWFVAKDICDILEIGDTRKSVGYLDDDERTTSPITDSLGRTQNTMIVSEAGMYSLVLRSRKPEAKAFKRWITHEVLPAIRKTGKYEDPDHFKEIMDRLGRMESNLIFQSYEPPKAKLISLEARYFCRLGIDKHTRKFYDAIMDYTGIKIPKGDDLPKGIFVYEYIFNNIPMEHIEEFVVGIERGNIVKSKEGHWINLNGYSVPSQWNKTLESFGHTCAYCGKSHYEETLLAEHIVPQSQMGLFDAAKTDYSFNVVPACNSCNYSKYTHPMELWYKHQKFYDEQRYQKILRHIKRYQI